MPKEMKLPVPENLEALLDEIQAKNDPAINVAGSVNRYLEMKAREKGVPIHGMFELTPLCNLDCKMCYVHLTKEQMGNRKLLTVDQWKLLIDQAVKAGMMDATLTGGECLTYNGFNEVHKHLLSYGIGVSVLTNGLLLNEERIEYFKKNPVRLIQVTFYGSSDEVYEKVTGQRVFDTVIKNIEKAIAAGIRLKVGITPNRYMAEDDEKVIGYLSERNIPFSLNSNLYEARSDTGRSLKEYDQSIDDYIRLRKTYIKKKGILLPEECLELTKNEAKSNCGLRCGAGNSGFSIDWQGTLYACSMLNCIKAYPIEVGFEAAWKQVHNDAKTYPNPIECTNCKYAPLCTKCVAAHYSGAVPGHANPRICEIARKITEQIFDKESFYEKTL